MPIHSEDQSARLPAPTAPVNTPQAAPQRPAGPATLGDYKNALQRATAAGDEEAIAHFQGAIDQVLKQPTDATGKPIPQGGSILNPIGQGLTFGFLDELAGVGGGIASAGRGALGLTPEGQKDGFWQATTPLRATSGKAIRNTPNATLWLPWRPRSAAAW